ncbi:GPI mannosyltransferase 4-like [Artemia franciscana]|uniref:Mannosyltransferase n=1 Tax=Artemia franciscana TaxID=6661 RepID=A0AA88LB12_ARTSF|nr:hypothetical protein QYM36_009088 [Artemia franciscana]
MLREIIASDQYFLLVALRIILILLPQTGVADFEEYKDFVEPLAGWIFGVEATESITPPLPTKSMALPLLFIGLPFKFIEMLSPFLKSEFRINIVQPHYLLLIPRLVFTVLSFLNDFVMYKVAKACKIRPWTSLTLLGSSHVMLIFVTRPLRSSFELCLFSLLLWCVVDSVRGTGASLLYEKYINSKLAVAKVMKDKVNLRKKGKVIKGHNFKHMNKIAFLFTVGIFNRPSFVFFGLVPVFYWLYRGLDSYKSLYVTFHLRMMSLLPVFAITSYVHMFVDSLYYKDIDCVRLLIFQFNFDDVIIAPINYGISLTERIEWNKAEFRSEQIYNTVSNVIYMYGILGVFAFFIVFKIFYHTIMEVWPRKPKYLTLSGMFVTTYFFSLLLLSFTVYDAPVHIVALLPIFCLIFSSVMHGQTGMKGKFLRAVWYSWNMCQCLYLGFFNHGSYQGVLNEISGHLKTRPAMTQTFVILVDEFQPPLYPLFVKKVDAAIKLSNGLVYKPTKLTHIYDYSTMNDTEITESISGTVRLLLEKIEVTSYKYEMLVFLPAAISTSIIKKLPSNTKLKLQKRIYPHISMYDPIDLSDLCSKYKGQFKCEDPWKWFQKKLKLLSVEFYKAVL